MNCENVYKSKCKHHKINGEDCAASLKSRVEHPEEQVKEYQISASTTEKSVLKYCTQSPGIVELGKGKCFRLVVADVKVITAVRRT